MKLVPLKRRYSALIKIISKSNDLRMKSEGNIWALLWEQARTVPARRQRRLFDDTKEAEKVMTFLTGLSAGDLASLLHPVLLHAAHLRLLEASHEDNVVTQPNTTSAGQDSGTDWSISSLQ